MSEERELRTEEVLRSVSTQLGGLIADIASIKVDVSEIKTQTTKTNGKVIHLEKWQAYIKGAIGIVVLGVGWLIEIFHHR
jgi:hypothetical protein